MKFLEAPLDRFRHRARRNRKPLSRMRRVFNTGDSRSLTDKKFGETEIAVPWRAINFRRDFIVFESESHRRYLTRILDSGSPLSLTLNGSCSTLREDVLQL